MYPTYLHSYYNLLINACVRYDATNISTPSKRRNVYTAAGAQALNNIEKPHKAHFSQDIDTPSDDFYQVHQAKQGKSPPTTHIGGSEESPQKPTPSTPKKPLKNMMVQFMSLLKCVNSSALKLLLPSRNTTLRPSTSLPRKEVLMSLTLLTMSHPHQRIPLMRKNLTLINLMMHLKMRFTQFWTTSTASIMRKKISTMQCKHTMSWHLQPQMLHPGDPSTWSIPIYSIMLHRQNKSNMVHSWIAVPMVDLQVLNRKISMIFPLVSCCSCVNNPSSS